MKTQEDFKRAINKFLTKIKDDAKSKLAEDADQLKQKFERMGGDTEAVMKNLLWNKMKNTRLGQKVLKWFAKTLEKYSNEH